MYTEYSKVLNYFRSILNQGSCNTDLRNILYKFAELKDVPNDIGAARYLIQSYHDYQALIAPALSQANNHAK